MHEDVPTVGGPRPQLLLDLWWYTPTPARDRGGRENIVQQYGEVYAYLAWPFRRLIRNPRIPEMPGRNMLDLFS